MCLVVEIIGAIVYNDGVGISKIIRKFLKKPAATIVAVILVIVLVVAAYLVYEYFYKDDYRDGLRDDGTNTSTPTQSNTGIVSGNIVETHFIDVGQGDCILIRFYDGLDIMIDAGSGAARNPSQSVTDSVLAYLAAEELDAIDYFILTHPHSDHINIADEILAAYEVKNIWYNGYAASQTFYNEDFLPAAQNENAVVQTFDADGDIYTIAFADYSVTVYAPGYERFSNVNYMSPFVLLEYGGIKTLFTGDSEYAEQKWLMESELFAGGLDIDLLKVGHHGSQTSCNAEWLNFLTPEFAVISVGEGNSYGHPTQTALDNLYNSGTVTFRTSYHGAVVFLSDGGGNFAFKTEKDAVPENNKNGIAVPIVN